MFFIVYWALASRLKLQNCLLLIGSYIFYGWWDWRFLGLLILATLTTWGTALLSLKSHARVWIVANIVFNIAILVVFKYLGFFGDGLMRLFSLFGWNIDSFTIDILLPIGISFYTFQAIGYSIDVYRGEIAPTRSLLVFATYLSFFPQLLAGPIERGRQLLPQILRYRKWDYQLAVDGIRETLWGLFKKIAVADMCGVYIDSVYGNSEAGALKLSIASLLFVLQIYCDFSGYCNMARGLAAMLGVRLMVNFRYPLFSRSPADFWRRWHISLMTWFRDYVYIPLGGSRRGRYRTYINLLIVFMLSGLWHGASFNYLIWGAVWGIVMVIARALGQKKYYFKSVPSNSPSDILRIMLMGYLLTLTFIVFRFNDIGMALMVIARTSWLTAMIGAFTFAILMISRRIGPRVFGILGFTAFVSAIVIWFAVSPGQALACVVIGIFPASIVAMLAGEWWGRRRAFALERMPLNSTVIRLMAYWSILLAILFSGHTGGNFIYYQF